MLVLKLELHKFGNGEIVELGRMIIANDGGGDMHTGNYDVRLGRKGCQDHRQIYTKPVRQGRVENHKRLAENVWSLVGKALRAINF